MLRYSMAERPFHERHSLNAQRELVLKEEQQTPIVIDVPDQKSTRSVLERIRDLHLFLISLKLISPEQQSESQSPS